MSRYRAGVTRRGVLRLTGGTILATGIGGVAGAREDGAPPDDVRGPLVDGLVAYYPADDPEDPTTATDEAGDHDAPLYNGTSYGPGKVGSNSLSFDGDDDYAEAPGVGDHVDAANAFTVAYWINYRALEAYRVPYGSEPTGFWTEPYRNGSAGVSVAFTDATGTTHELNSGTVLDAANVWYHLAYTWDGEVLSAYLDGERVGTLDTGGATCVTGSLHRIGRWGISGFYLDGLMDEIRVYDRALSPPEVRTLSNLKVPTDLPDEADDEQGEGDENGENGKKGHEKGKGKGDDEQGEGDENGENGKKKGHGKGKKKGNERERGEGRENGRGRGR